MNVLFTYTNAADTKSDHFNSVKNRLNNKYEPDFYDREVKCEWALESSRLQLPFEFRELNIIFIYMTNELDTCKYLDSIVISPARQYNIKIIFVYADSFAPASLLSKAMQFSNSIIPLDALERLNDLDGVYLDKEGNSLGQSIPDRHGC